MAGRAVRVDVRMMIATWPEAAPRGAVSRFCREHGISRSRFYELRAVARQAGAFEAVAPTVPARARADLAIPAALEAMAVRLRKELADGGWDAGPVSVRAAMRRAGIENPPAASTLARVFTRQGMVTPAPRKRPRSSWRRFTFAQVHECWQLDATEVALAEGPAPRAASRAASTAVVFQLLDDHSRLIVGSVAAAAEVSAAAVAVFMAAVARVGQAPVLLLTDNGTALNPHRRGAVSDLVRAAEKLGTRAITSRAYHPQTLGKNERVHSTLKRWLAARPAPADLSELTVLLAQFDAHYNTARGHQAHKGLTPAEVAATHQWAVPPAPAPASSAPTPAPDRRRHGPRRLRVGPNGSVHVRGVFIGLGVEHAGSDVHVLVEDPPHQGTPPTQPMIAVFDARGTLLRQVQLSAGTTYYGTGRVKGGPARARRRARITPPADPDR